MTLKAYIRKETKNRWEARAPLTPKGVRTLVSRNIPIWVEHSDIRAFKDETYEEAGAHLAPDCAEADVVLGIKEPAVDSIRPGQVHVAFSHTIKGQAYNMTLLRTFLERGATLIDYELMRNEQGERVIAFGRYAGLAGAIDTFHFAGKKLAIKNRKSVLGRVKKTYRYGSLARIKKALKGISFEPEDQLRVLIVGTGRVSRGSGDACRWLGLNRIEPGDLLGDRVPEGNWYCILGTPDIVRARDGAPYERADYRARGIAGYESTFLNYLGKFDILLQTPYWEEKYPRQLTREQMRAHKQALPYMIGDISCDIEGSLACSLKETTIDEPTFTYDPETHQARDGISWDGPSVMSISHLPCEIPVDASKNFSKHLVKYLPDIITMDLDKPYENCGLPPLLHNAVIVYKGELTPAYRYLERHLNRTE